MGTTNVRVVVGDAAEIDLGDGYDRVLVDPPCSDLGTLASRPDARWRKSPELIERVARVQAAILDRAVDALNTGGALAYSVCTVSQREGPDRTEPVVTSGRVRPVDPGQVLLRPDRDRTDGFFIARMERA
jgi:16S rRNA (cytosine967-C5)-methyltransferase